MREKTHLRFIFNYKCVAHCDIMSTLEGRKRNVSLANSHKMFQMVASFTRSLKNVIILKLKQWDKLKFFNSYFKIDKTATGYSFRASQHELEKMSLKIFLNVYFQEFSNIWLKKYSRL